MRLRFVEALQSVEKKKRVNGKFRDISFIIIGVAP